MPPSFLARWVRVAARPAGRRLFAGGILLALTPAAPAVVVVRQPFAGVRWTQRTQTFPRPLSIHVLEIDLTHPGIRFQITPSNGPAPGELNPQTVRSYVTSVGAQIGINASFFLTSAAGTNFDNRGLVASQGDVYSPFDGDNRPWPVFNLSADNFATIVNQATQPSTSTAVTPAIPLYNAVSGSERILTNGRVTAGAVTYGEPTTLQPRTVAGITSDRRLVIATIDGRQSGTSEGFLSRESAELLLQYGVVDAVNFDGGGSTTLVFADPTPRVVNRISDPVERSVGASLAIFADRTTAPGEIVIYGDFFAGDRGGFSAAPGAPGGHAEGLLTTSTNATVESLQAVQRGWFQRLTLCDDPTKDSSLANPDGWFLRHLWVPEAAGNTPRPATGHLGYWARTSTGGLQTSVAINAPGNAARGILRPLAADGAWHLYEWDLANASQWEPWSGGDGRIAGGTFTLDSIQLFGPNADAVVDLDLVSHHALGSVASLVPADNGRLINASIRSSLSAVDPTLTAGFTLSTGTPANKTFLLRAAGPSLATFGVAGVVPNPRFTLFDARGNAVVTNDRWGGAASLAAIFRRVGAFPFVSDTSLDDAALVSLNAGKHLIEVSSPTGAAGVTVVEAYDATESVTAGAPRLINLAARGRVGTGAETLMVGFVVQGGPKRVVLRAVGPGLTPFGIQGALADPQLALYAGSSFYAQNDDWGGGPVLTDVFSRAGAFALTSTSRDAALLMSLAPGVYIAQVRGANATSGLALLELYEVP